jgi:hypothetical protein
LGFASRCRGKGEHADAALGVGAVRGRGGEKGEDLADQVEGAAEVDVEDEVHGVEGHGVQVLVEDLAGVS